MHKGLIKDEFGRFSPSEDVGKYLKGFEKTPMLERTYGIWRAMVNRARNKSFSKNHHSAEVYKDVGITERWLGDNGFKNFVNDVGLCPSEKHSINRVNGHKCYENGFVEWTTATEQKYDTKLQNNNTSGVRGISKNKRGFWVSYIRKGGVKITMYQGSNFNVALQKRVEKEYELYGFSKTVQDFISFGLNENMRKNLVTEEFMQTLIKEK